MTDRDDADAPDRPGEDGSADAAAVGSGFDARQRQSRRRVRSREAAAISGMAYAVLALVGLLLLRRFPSLDQSDEEISAWFDDSWNRRSLIIGLNLAALSSIAFLWFVAVIRRRLGNLEDRFFGTVFFGSSIAYVSVWLAAGAALAGPAVATSVLDSGSTSGSSASLAAGIGAGLILVVAPRIQAVFVLTTSTVILRSGILPRWLAMVGYVMALAMFLVPLITELAGLGFPIWVFVISIAMFVHRQGGTGNPMASA